MPSRNEILKFISNENGTLDVVKLDNRRKFRIESAETLKVWYASGVQLTAAVQIFKI